jgi:DNA-binding NarL/FixJ family response regulator
MILGISLYTVQKHVANLLCKLDVENRHALTVSALNHAAGR